MRFTAATLLFAGSVMAGQDGEYTTVTQTSTTLACPSSVTDCPLRNSPSTWAASNPASSSTAGWVSPASSLNVAATKTAEPSQPSTFSTAWSRNSTSHTYKATGSADWTACDCEDTTSCGSSWTSGSTGSAHSNGGSGSGANGNGGSWSGGSGSGSSGGGANANGGSWSGGSGSGSSGSSSNGNGGSWSGGSGSGASGNGGSGSGANGGGVSWSGGSGSGSNGNGGAGSGTNGNGVSWSGGSGSGSGGNGASGSGANGNGGSWSGGSGSGVTRNGTVNGTVSTSSPVGVATAGASAVAPAFMAIVAGLVAFLA